VIFMEDLAVKNMQRNHCLAGSISDVAWSEFVRQLEYKQRWSGGELVKIDRFFPSSKMCSNCHHVLDRLPLNVREWTCPKCKTVHDRDVNAAKNILQAGCQLGVEGTDGICGIRPMKRVTGLKKRGNLKKMLSTAKTGV
jgi:putative transposase